MSGFSFNLPPPVAGYYCFGENAEYKLTFRSKPRWLHRKMVGWLLGGRWRDAS